MDSKVDAIFVTALKNRWSRVTLLASAQRAWARAGLPRKKIHEVRHTLGTLAGRYFTPGMVQAAMGHRNRRSAEAYFHPSEEMAAEVRQKVNTEISRNMKETIKNDRETTEGISIHNGEFECPHCGHKYIVCNG
jgi:hypothetical protein